MLDYLWYRRNCWCWLLRPLGWLFRVIAMRRKRAYQTGKKPVFRPAQPVIIVGNISVGGNGKTPVVLALCQFLSQQGYHPAIISRGYGGQAKSNLWVDEHSDARICGDEPLLLRQRSGCPVVIGADRRASVELLNQRYPECDVIIADDGMQHYRLARDIELCVVDCARQFGNGYCLPAGPLREPVERLAEVDRIIANGGPIDDYPADVMTLKAEQWCLVSSFKPVEQASLPSEGYVMAGIGNPQRFYQTVQGQGISLQGQIEIGDHRRLSSEQIQQYYSKPLFMTEKDALKYQQEAGPQWYYLPVTATLPDAFYSFILEKLEQLNATRS